MFKLFLFDNKLGIAKMAQLRGETILSGNHQRGVAVHKAIEAWEPAFACVSKLEPIVQSRNAGAFYEALKVCLGCCCCCCAALLLCGIVVVVFLLWC